MKCLIPGANVKILGRAVHTMAKVGDDLYVESSRGGLSLKTINSSDSAFCKMSYDVSFFTYFNHSYPLADDEENFVCKISTKSALSVFKSPSQTNKQVEMCELRLNPDRTKLVFQMRWKMGTTRSFYLSILDSQKMEVTYDKETIPNRILAQHKVFLDAVNNFPASEDQLTFEATPQLFILKNYQGTNIDSSKVTNIQLSLKPLEFEIYSIGIESSATFSTKEFRAMLMFAEAVNLSVSVYFDTSGKPVIFEISNDATFEVDFVIATERSDNNNTQSTNSTAATGFKRKNSTQVEKSKYKKTFLENDIELEKCLQDSDFLDSIDVPNNLQVEKTALECSNVNARTENLELENIREESSSPILSSQTNIIKRVFRRCFENTMDFSETRKCAVLADDSDCE